MPMYLRDMLMVSVRRDNKDSEAYPLKVVRLVKKNCGTYET